MPKSDPKCVHLRAKALNMESLIYPPRLREGDRVIILSPSSKIDKAFLRGAARRLKSWGLEPVLASHAGSSHGTYAGSVAQRLKDLQEAMDDPKARAIFCSRGGYGAVHLVDKLDFTRFRQQPKWLIGFSDITALHNVFQHEGFVSLHAPMARHLTVEPDDDPAMQALHDILFGQYPEEKQNFDIVCEAHRLNHVGERPHAVERMMYNLKLGGVLERLCGLIIGQFTEYEENRSLGKPLYEALADVLKPYDIPVCFGFPVGHVTRNMPLPCGAEAVLEVGKKEVTLSFK